MRIFIAGASGLVGSNCYYHFTAEGMNVLGSYFSFPTKNTVYFNTLDIHDTANADLAAFRPDIIVHCGALTHVDYCEDHVEESYNKTVVSTKNLLEIAKQSGAKLVYISTDYVFDGKHGPYEEEAKTNPLSVYAKHKLEAEQMTLAANKNNLVLRVTNVYGKEERNKNFVARILDQCVQKQTLHLTLPYDQYATPVNAWDIARAMLVLLKENRSGIFHIGGTDWMNRVELAFTVLKYFPEAKYTMQPMQTTEMQQAANRPLRGGLLKHKFSSLYPTFLFSNVDSFVQEFIQNQTL